MCKKAKTCRGSITVFASLALLLVASFLLALLEAARVEGLESYAEMNRVNALESVLSEYNRELFEEYGIFLLDVGYGSGTVCFSQMNSRLQEVCQKNLRPAVTGSLVWDTPNFYQMDVSDAVVTHYVLATDYNGAPFRRMAAESMKLRYPLELARKLQERLASSDETMEQGKQSRLALDHAQTELEAAKEQQAQERTPEAAGVSKPDDGAAAPAAPVENPIEVIKKLRETDLLTLVLPEGSRVSEKAISDKDTLERRSLQQGNEPWKDSGGWYEKLCYHQFLNTYFSCFTSEKKSDGALDYELEYIHAGKLSDRENLKRVVQELLLLREGANFLYLQGDAAKKEEAYAVAAALLAPLGLSAVIPAAAQGILAAWAFGESVLDVRTLLAGKRVPWMKTAESWTSSLSGLGAALTGGMKAEEQASGENYEGYLQKLLYLKSEKLLNYRAMDLMEQRLRQKSGYGQVRMDSMALFLRGEVTCEAAPLFSSMVTLQRLRTDRLVFSGTVQDGYLPEE